jgi:hypothetical protein
VCAADGVLYGKRVKDLSELANDDQLAAEEAAAQGGVPGARHASVVIGSHLLCATLHPSAAAYVCTEELGLLRDAYANTNALLTQVPCMVALLGVRCARSTCLPKQKPSLLSYDLELVRLLTGDWSCNAIKRVSNCDCQGCTQTNCVVAAEVTTRLCCVSASTLQATVATGCLGRMLAGSTAPSLTSDAPAAQVKMYACAHVLYTCWCSVLASQLPFGCLGVTAVCCGCRGGSWCMDGCTVCGRQLCG